MIRADFYESKGNLIGFSVSGHAGYADSGQDIVCASVSSAVMLTANLLTECFCPGTEVSAEGGTIICKAVPDRNSEYIISMLRDHIEAISEEFPKTIKITITEV